MAQSCNPQALFSASPCAVTCLDPKQAKAIQVRLLCAILNGEIMACDKDTLMANANCLMCLEPWQLDAIMVYLLCQIMASGAVGGGTVVTCGDVAPVAAPTGTCGLYYQRNTGVSPGSLYYWDAGSASWVPLVGGP